MRLLMMAWAIPLSVIGCGELGLGGSPLSDGGFPSRPQTFEAVQYRGTENSYHVASATAEDIPEWDYTHLSLSEQLSEQGIRHIDLDVAYSFLMDSTYVVMNGPHGDAASTCKFLYDCLEELAAWSAAHPTHQPLVLTLGPSRGGAFGMVDTLFHLHELLRAYLGDRLFTPDDLRRDGETVRDALLARGWPAVSALRGRFIVVLNDRGEVRQSYLDDAFGLADDPEDLMFVLADDPRDPYAAFFEYPAITDDVVDEVAGLIAQGFLVRTFVDDPANRARAIAMGAHFLSTRFPDDTLPRDALHGWPVACNPVTAEEGCRPQWFGSE